MLQLGGALLPDLVEFYQWIHTHLSYLVTYERATKISIGNVISLSAKRYSQKVCTNLTNLFERIISKYNSYTYIVLCKHGNYIAITCSYGYYQRSLHVVKYDKTRL